MRIGIIGAGFTGRAVAFSAVKAGHGVMRQFARTGDARQHGGGDLLQGGYGGIGGSAQHQGSARLLAGLTTYV